MSDKNKKVVWGTSTIFFKAHRQSNRKSMFSVKPEVSKI
jgi:hypothetical protein